MKKRGEKRREILRPSPNEEANILQSDKVTRKKLRLKQVRDQEKAFSRKVLEDARRRKTVELKNLTSNLQSQWDDEHNKKKSILEQKYQENLAEVGLGHKTASEDQTNYNKPELSGEEKQRASERYKKALEQLMYDRAKDTQSERECAEARQRALETEQLRAAKIAALPPPVDLIGDFYLKKDQKTVEQKHVDSFSMTRFHLRPSVHVERDLDPNQEDARQAAIDEEQRMQTIKEDVQRDKAEQIEKARLRHKHALAQLQLQEDHKKLMEELDQLERQDRQRRQNTVAKIPVRIFQPPHKRLEDAEDRQRDLEQVFEDMYMIQTGYTGDLTVALEPPENLKTASEDSIQSVPGSDKRSVESEEGREPLQMVPSAIGPDRISERVEHRGEQEREPEEAVPRDDAPKAHSAEDPLQRLLQRIERQRDQWRRRQLTVEPEPPMAIPTGIPRTLPSRALPSKGQEYRVPDTIPFSASPESLAEVELPAEEPEDAVAERPHLEDTHSSPPVSDVQRPDVSSARTLLHPLEAAQRSRTTTPSGRAVTAQLTQQEALLEQQKLKLKLQQQTLLQQQLEQQLQEYQRQLGDIYGSAEAPGLGALERVSLEEPFSGEPPYEGVASLTDSGPGGVQATQGTVLPTLVPADASQEGSLVMSEALESSTLGSLTSDETEAGLPSEFERTLAAARVTADKAAELRQRERDVLQELSRVALEDVPFSSHTHSERGSSHGSTPSLQTHELVNISTPSTLTLSVTMPSELSVTTATSRTLTSRYFDHALPSTLQTSRSPFSDVADTASITAATSLLTKTSQHYGFARDPSASVRPFSVLSSASEVDSRISGVLPSSVPSSRVIAEQSRSNPVAFATGSESRQAAVVGDPQSSAVQQSNPGYSPGYLDYYQQKMEEERQLFEAQRNRIRRYSGSLKKSSLEGPGTQTYKPPGDLSKNAPIAETRMITPYLSDLHGGVPTYFERNAGAIGLDTNKENQGYIANSAGLRGQDRLQDISQRLGAFEKSLTSSGKPTAVTSSSYTSKPSTSEWSYGSSTEYYSLPRISAGRGLVGSVGSTLSSLSELTEMMTRLTSTSDESEIKSSRDAALAGHGGPSTTGTSSAITTGPLDYVQSYAPMETSTKLSGAKEPAVSVPAGSRWTRGSDGKQWFVLSQSSTLSSAGMLGKDNIALEREGEDNVFRDVMGNRSPVSGSEETGSIASLPSGTLRSDTAERLDESSTSSEVHGLASSTLSSVSNESHGASSQASDFHGDSSGESNTGK